VTLSCWIFFLSPRYPAQLKMQSISPPFFPFEILFHGPPPLLSFNLQLLFAILAGKGLNFPLYSLFSFYRCIPHQGRCLFDMLFTLRPSSLTGISLLLLQALGTDALEYGWSFRNSPLSQSPLGAFLCEFCNVIPHLSASRTTPSQPRSRWFLAPPPVGFALFLNRLRSCSILALLPFFSRNDPPPPSLSHRGPFPFRTRLFRHAPPTTLIREL